LRGYYILALLELKDVTRRYKLGQVQVTALGGVSLSIQDGEYVSIMGPSGSGKSTLLNIIGCLDLPTTGTYIFKDKHMEDLRDGELADIRNRRIGFVFQQFHLLPNLTALENVELPLIYQGVWGKERRERAEAALESVGLGDRINHLPFQMSGGEQQRVAISRAIVGSPSLILADEPTGALDSHSSRNIMEIFQRLNRDMGITVVQVTHEREVALYSRKIYHLRDGIIEKVETINNQGGI
jgi:putative ABC transport system ATP-binding protein